VGASAFREHRQSR
jgi:exonuclease III